MYRHDWPPPGAYPPLAHLLFFGLSNLFWIGLLGTLFWMALAPHRLANRRAVSSPEPSALELLQRSYIVGQIDVDTFAEMVVPILESEEFARYHRLSPPTPL